MSNIILQLSIWSVLLPLVAGFLFFKQLDEPSRIIFCIVILAISGQLGTAFVPHNTKPLNVIYNIYTPVEFLLTYLLVGSNYMKRLFTYISLALVVSFAVLTIIMFVHSGIYDKFLNELVCAANIIYLIWIFMFILQGLLTDQKLMNHRLPMFWFISGLLLYTPCTIFVFALAYYIDESKNPFIHSLWSIHGVFNAVMYILFAIGFYKSYRLVKTGTTIM